MDRVLLIRIFLYGVLFGFLSDLTGISRGIWEYRGFYLYLPTGSPVEILLIYGTVMVLCYLLLFSRTGYTRFIAYFVIGLYGFICDFTSIWLGFQRYIYQPVPVGAILLADGNWIHGSAIWGWMFMSFLFFTAVIEIYRWAKEKQGYAVAEALSFWYITMVAYGLPLLYLWMFR